jgi:hypothetical protein
MNEPTRDNALSRIYREGSWPEPSRQIDQAIIAASRRAAREQSFVRRWAPSFAVAATVVLTSTLVIKIYQEQPEVVALSVPDKAEARAKQPAPAAEPKGAETKSAAPLPTPQPVVPPRGFTSTMDSGEAERLNRLQQDLGLKQSLPASESPLPAPGTRPAEKSAAALKKEVSDAPRASPTPREQQPANAPVSVFGAPPPASAQQPPRAAAAKPVTQNALPAARPEAAQPTPATSPIPAEAASADSISSNPLAGALAARIGPKAAERTPQSWIEDIRKLVSEGKLEQADREIADFKKRYPDFALPGDLR